MTPDTLQLTILKRLTAHLEGAMIGLPTGDVSLAGRVFRGRTLFGVDEQTPFVSILEGKRPDQLPPEVGYDSLNRNEDWHLLVQGWQDDNPDSPLDNLYRLKGVVEQQLAHFVAVEPGTGQALYPEVYLLGGLISEMRIGPGVVRAANPQVGGVEAFYLPVIVTFAMNVADPFSLE